MTQVVSNDMGKILRINQDGSIPLDNPFTVNESTRKRAVYSIGHRNPQSVN